MLSACVCVVCVGTVCVCVCVCDECVVIESVGVRAMGECGVV